MFIILMDIATLATVEEDNQFFDFVKSKSQALKEPCSTSLVKACRMYKTN
jgi:hypothetical protein